MWMGDIIASFSFSFCKFGKYFVLVFLVLTKSDFHFSYDVAKICCNKAFVRFPFRGNQRKSGEFTQNVYSVSNKKIFVSFPRCKGIPM